MTREPDDPRGLIAEAYRIEGIGLAECRSIFLDWSLDRAIADPVAAAQRLALVYGVEHPEHPMTQVLRDAAPQEARRRGGRAGRRRE